MSAAQPPAAAAAAAKRTAGYLVEFETPGEVLAAAERVRDAGFTRWDAHSPYPVHGLDGESLCLELTESAIMETGTAVNGTLLAMKEMGVRLSLDDFGTGYSSLSYLRHLPIDELKIDRSFVAEFDVAGDSAAVITRAVIAMAQGLGLRVVAEGVETQSQLAFLRANGCDECQGFLFSRPLPAGAFQALDWQADLGLRPGAVPALDSGALPRTGAAASVDDGSSRVLSLAG